MATYTEADLASVKAAIASGELSVLHNGRRVEYRSISELLRAKAVIEAELAAGATGPAGGIRRFTFTTMRGE